MNDELRGPKGGRTTRTSRGMYRLVVWIHPDEREALRRAAYVEDTSMAAIVREALRSRLGIED